MPFPHGLIASQGSPGAIPCRCYWAPFPVTASSTFHSLFLEAAHWLIPQGELPSGDGDDKTEPQLLKQETT